MLKKQTNSEGSSWYNITRSLLFINSSYKIRFWHKGIGIKNNVRILVTNCRFYFSKHKGHKARWTIRVPFFYWHRHGGGWEFGLPNHYLWWHEMRTKRFERKLTNE